MTITNERLSNLDIKYHFLIDNILDVVGELDLNGIFTYVNPYIYDELGYQPDEIIGREIYEFVHPDDAKKITKVLLRRPKSHDFIPEIRLKNDKNQFIWYEIKARRIKDYNNQRKILITLKNISKVKELEEKLEKKEENYQKITNSIPEIQFWKVLTHSKYERAVRTTSEMLKVIIENIPQCVFWKDTNFKYLGCNGNYSEFIGIEHPENIIGKTDEDLLSNREKIQQIKESETSVMLSGKPLYHTNESWIIEKGENIWLDINRVPLIDTKGDVNGILVAFEEITDRKIAEEKLQNSEKKYKNLSSELETIMDIIPSMIFVKNKSGIYTRVNQVFADYLKLEKEDVIGKSTFDLFSQEVATRLKRDDLEVIKNGIPKLNIEETVEFPVGKVSGIISKMPYYNEKDEINGVIGFAIDISERKELEQRLIKSEERYRELANLLPQVICEADERGNLTFVNINAYSVFGYTPDDFNKGLNALQMLIPEDRNRAMENTKRVLRGKKEEKMGDNEYTALRKDGSTFPVIIYSSPIIYKDVSVGTRSIIIDITDKMKAEQRLKESEANYRLITENANDIITVLDDKFRPEYISETPLNKMLGYNSIDLIGKSDFLVIHPDDRKMVLNGLIKGSEVGKGISDARLRHKDGHYIWVESRGKTFIDGNGEKKILINLRNISERKVAEQKLEESEEKYRLLFENANDAISILDLEGNFYEVNNLYCTRLGYTREEILESNIRDIVTPEYVDLVSNRILDIREKGFNIFESAHKAKDGRIIPVEISSKSILYDHKPSILSILRDITERKVAEQKLKESEEKYKNLFEQIPLSILLINFEGIIKDCNTSAEVLFGYTKKEILGFNFLKFEIFPLDTKSILATSFSKYLKTGVPEHSEIQLRKKDGKMIWISSYPIQVKIAEKSYILAVIQDITERKKTEEEIRNLAKFPSENPNPVLRLTREKVIYSNMEGEKIFNTKEGSEVPVVLQKSILKAFDTNKAQAIEVDLNNRTHSIDITPISEEGYANVYGRDITDKKEAEIAIRESEKKLKDLIEAIPIGITISNPAGELFEVNSHAINTFGYDSREDYLKTPAINFYANPEDRLQYTQLLKSGPVKDFEAKFKRKNGKLFWGSLTSISKTVGEDVIYFNTVQDISHRKSMEKIFTDLAKFPAENPNPVLRVSKEFVLYANQAGNRLFQVTVGDKIPLTLESYVRNAFNENKNLNPEIQLNSHIFSIFITPIEKTEYANVYGMDITERTIAEKKLKESEENYRLITENANDIIAVLDDKFRLEYVSEAPLNKMLGYKSVDYIGISDLLVIHPDDRKMVLNELIKGSKAGEGISDSRVRHQDGHYIWVESRGKTFIDGNGEKKILINIRNITEQKKAEQQLRESEAKHRGLLETAVMGLIEIDLLLNKISYINPKLLEIVGYTKEELIDDSFFYNLIHPEDLEELLKSHGDRDVEFRIYSKEGKLKWLSGTRKYTVSENGELINVRLWLQDITESKEVEEIKTNLLTRFSHEFKTPLISITGFADFLLTEHKNLLDKKTLLFLKRIKDGSDRLKKLINSFVESSQLDKAIVQLNLRQENLYDLINEALDELEGLRHLRKHEIDLNIGKKLITSLDKEKIYTVITNLLINAFNYSPKSGKIVIQSKIDKKSIVISIKDTGIGLDESEIIRLFKPFGKIERYGKGWDIVVGGMGMGLFISKELIELHDGKIWAESEGRNKGSTFHFSIPITK